MTTNRDIVRFAQVKLFHKWLKISEAKKTYCIYMTTNRDFYE